jgi:hypothetical protein
MTIGLDPVIYAAIKESAAEVGVSASAWAALRLGEAVRAQRKVGGFLDQLGLDMRELVREEANGGG